LVVNVIALLLTNVFKTPYLPASQICVLTTTAPLLDMYPLAYPVGAVPNTAVSQVE
jgi:hypothetical protein